jgi:hypothetical protein
MYDENGKYIDASISYFSKNQATKISDNVFQHVFKHNGYLSTGVRTFRVSLTKTVDVSPKDSQKITIDDLNTVEIFSEEYWKMGTSGPELTSTPIINEAMTQSYPSTLWRIGPTEYNGKNYYNKGTPYHMLLNDVPELYILGEYWMIDSYPFIDGLELIPVFEDPKPLGLFSIDGGYPYYEGRKLINVLEEPEPLGIFRSNGGYPFFRGLNLIQIGAFSNATNLKYATIPESVKYIGKYAFRGTQLKEVKLADDCEYYSTSFPHNCVVNGGIIKT